MSKNNDFLFLNRRNSGVHRTNQLSSQKINKKIKRSFQELIWWDQTQSKCFFIIFGIEIFNFTLDKSAHFE